MSLTPSLAILSVHSHGDRSFLDDRELAVVSGELSAAGVRNDLVVAVLADEADAAFERLVEVLRGYDVIVYERVWSVELVAALRDRLPDRVFVSCEGEHRIEDPPADYVCSGDLVASLVALSAVLRAEEVSLVPGTRFRDGGHWQLVPGRRSPPLKRPFRPNLSPVLVNPEALPELRTFAVLGNAGCPYQADARDNPLYAGVRLPVDMGRGCAFCTTGNRYEGAAQSETLASVLEQIRVLRSEAPHIEHLVLKDQNPFGYLEQLLSACAGESIAPFTLLLETRADWFLRARERLERALRIAARAGYRIAPYLVGVESFAQAELDRMNKGVSAETNVEFLDLLWSLSQRHPKTLDLSVSSFGFILWTPWTTPEDLKQNLEGIRRTRLSELRGQLLLSRARLYPDTALYYLAERDGLLAESWETGGDDPSARYGYFPGQPWRFQNEDTARLWRLTVAAWEQSQGRDEVELFERVLAAPAADVVAPPTHTDGATVEVRLSDGCELDCPICDSPATVDPLAELSRGGRTAVIRIGRASAEAVTGAVRAARAAGFAEVVVASHALMDEAELRRLSELGVDRLRAMLFCHVPRVNDAIGNRPDALVSSLVCWRAAESAGLGLELEIPLLLPRLSRLMPIVELAQRAVSRVHRVRLFVPQTERARPIARALADVEGELAQVIRHCRTSGIEVAVHPADGIPLCALREHPQLLDAFRFDPRRPVRLGPGRSRPDEPCGSCVAARHCGGVRDGERPAGGWSERPPALAPPARRTWTDAQREAASRAELVVLRPTVNCNQDCRFCSANETSHNVWTDGDEMLRAVARAARRGVTHLSFSGGEPTLSPDLPEAIAAAKRLGIAKIELVTNGVLLDREAKVRRLADAGLSHAFVSLHAHDEALSQRITRKKGDFDRTVAAIEHLLAAGVRTSLNHVICSENSRHLEHFVRFVHERFGPRVFTSFAFVTPQYRALGELGLMPRLSEVMPVLRRALHLAVELGQPFTVGSRQGIPPCFLGELRAWSDVLYVENAARGEDAVQKIRAPACDSCRFSPVCTGLWKPYAQRYGTEELSPVPGAPIDDQAKARFIERYARTTFGVPRNFDDVLDDWREPALEAEGRALTREPELPDEPVAVVPSGARRPLRVLLAGSGRRARLIATELRDVEGLVLDAVASPHGPERRIFGGCPSYRDVAEAIAAQRPDALIVAAASRAHKELALLACAERIPCLVEKPLADNVEDAAAIAHAARESGILVMPLHPLLFAPAMDHVLAAAGALSVVRRVTPSSPEALPAWNRRAVTEVLVHLLSLARHGRPELTLDAVQVAGVAKPERIRVALTSARGPAELVLELGAPVDELEVRCGALVWLRRGSVVTLDGAPVEPRQSELAALLDAFAAAARGAAPAVTVDDGAAVVDLAHAAVAEMERAGALFERPGAPKHAASRDLL